MARWATQTEQYITQLLHKPVTGRGSNISLLQAPLVDSTTSRTWMRGAVAFWEKLNVRINVVHHSGHKRVLRDLSHMMVDVHRYGSDDFQADLFLAILQQWLQSPAKDPAELKAIVLDQEQKAQKQALYSTSLEFQEWLSKAHQKGLGGLFRSLRLRDQAWQRPFQSLPAPERIRAREPSPSSDPRSGAPSSFSPTGSCHLGIHRCLTAPEIDAPPTQQSGWAGRHILRHAAPLALPGGLSSGSSPH